MRKKCVLSSIILLTCFYFQVTYGADWTRWRGPTSDGISPETEWTPTTLKNISCILWETNVGSGHSAVAVRGNYLYIIGNKGTVVGKDTTFADNVYCLNAHTGKEIWRYSYPCANVAWPGPRSSPIIDENYVYTLSWEGHIFCFDAQKGNVIWTKHLLADSLSARPGWGFCSSPVVEGQLLLITAGKSGAALDKKTGKVLWKSERRPCNLTTPVVFTQNGKRLALFADEQDIHAVDVKTGKIEWSYQWNSTNDPVIIGDKIYLTGGRRGSMALQLSATGPKVLWESRSIAGGFQGVIAVNGYMYGYGYVRRQQPLQCIDINTGELKWSKDLGEYGAFIAADGKLIIIEGDGELTVAEANPTAFKVIASTRIITMLDNSKLAEGQRHYCWTNPVLANGRVYVRDNYGNLVCVNMQMKAKRVS